MAKSTFDDKTRSWVVIGDNLKDTREVVRDKNIDQVITHFTKDHFGEAIESSFDVDVLLNSIWEKGLRRLKKLKEAVESSPLPPPKSNRRKRRWSDEGDEINIDRVMRGEQNVFELISRETVTDAQPLTVFIMQKNAVGVSWEQAFWAVAAAIVVVDQLEAAGYRCEVWRGKLTDRCYQNGDNFAEFTKVKDAGQDLDMAEMSKAMSAWYYRTCSIGAMVERGIPVSGTLGTPVLDMERSKYLIGEYCDVDKTNTVLFGTTAYSEELALEAAKELLSQFVDFAK